MLLNAAKCQGHSFYYFTEDKNSGVKQTKQNRLFSSICAAYSKKKSTCTLFTKHRERIQKFRGTGNLKHFYKNELDKACFAHDAAYYDSKDLAKRTIPDKILKDGTYEIVRNRGYDGYQKH